MARFEEQARRLAELKNAVAEARAMVSASHAALQRAARERGLPGPITTERAFARFSDVLQQGSLRDALAYLVGLTDYRFVSIFRFQGGKATSVVHFDKQDPTVEQADEVPDTATYCRFIRDRDSAFATLDAAFDPRTDGHPAKNAIAAYCGVPVMTPEGDLLGTFCYYDTVPRDPGQLDLELQLQVASALARSGRLPDYPTFPVPA